MLRAAMLDIPQPLPVLERARVGIVSTVTSRAPVDEGQRTEKKTKTDAFPNLLLGLWLVSMLTLTSVISHPEYKVLYRGSRGNTALMPSH